jgi:hypothetical protein
MICAGTACHREAKRHFAYCEACLTALFRRVYGLDRDPVSVRRLSYELPAMPRRTF